MSSLFKGGRIPSTRSDVVDFISSLPSDERLLSSVIEINMAHVVMMVEEGIIPRSVGVQLLKALQGVQEEVKPRRGVEDVHVAVEEAVIGKVGVEVGGNLHMGKSRNDQVSAAIRMELRRSLLQIMGEIVALQEAILLQAQSHVETIIPGFTHLQPAQPTTLGHYLLAHVDGLDRSLERLVEAYFRVNLSPMGAGALAATSFPINRERVAELLGFDGLLENSIDAVGSRDFILEVLAALSILAVDLSRFAEDLILWSSPGFGIIDLPDEFCSTSSIMPQKKNPDVLEVVRARMANILGDFLSSATIMKALPSSYNLDLQEVTPHLWSSIDELSSTLPILAELVRNLGVREAPNPALWDFITSTELANMLVRKCGVPFRTSHRIVGALIRHLAQNGLSIHDITPEMIRRVARQIDSSLTINISVEDIQESISLSGFVRSHRVRGGPSPTEVRRMINTRLKRLTRRKRLLQRLEKRLMEARERLRRAVESQMEGLQGGPQTSG